MDLQKVNDHVEKLIGMTSNVDVKKELENRLLYFIGDLKDKIESIELKANTDKHIEALCERYPRIREGVIEEILNNIIQNIDELDNEFSSNKWFVFNFYDYEHQALDSKKDVIEYIVDECEADSDYSDREVSYNEDKYAIIHKKREYDVTVYTEVKAELHKI